MEDSRTYLIVDGENIDATLGLSVLGRRPEPDERPRWDRVLAQARSQWHSKATGLFFLNASSGHMPMSFVQALMAMDYRPIPLAGPLDQKVVDIGVQRTLDAILDQGYGDVLLATHDADFLPQLTALLAAGRRVGVLCFKEFLSSQISDLAADGAEILDLEHNIGAFQVSLPRLHIISLEEFDPYHYL